MPTGALPIGIGLLISGFTVYAFSSLTAHVLGPKKYASISVLWSIVFVLGPGVFLPFQQLLNHEFAFRRAKHIGAAPVAYRATLIAGAVVSIFLVCIWITIPELKKYLFSGSTELVIGFALAIIGYSMLYLVFGILTGSGRFGYVAFGQSLEGLLRIAVCVILAIVGIKSAGPYGIVFGVVPAIVAIAVFVPNLHLLEAGPPVDGRAVSTSLIWLIVGSVGSQLLVNGSVIAFKILSTHINQSQVGSFVAGVVIARIPLFFFGAIQSTLLPQLSAHSHAGEYQQLNRSIKRTSVLIAVVGIVCTVCIFIAGPWALRIFFGQRFVLSRATMSILAGTISIYMLAMVAAQGLIALGKAAYSAFGWIIGSLVFAGLLFTNSSLMTRVELAYLVATFLTFLAEYGLFWIAQRRMTLISD